MSSKTEKRYRFIIQKHSTEHPHHDLILEMGDGVRSWIIPREIAMCEGENRIAIEDGERRIDSFDSQGITEDGYGIGETEVWDGGFFEIEERRRETVVFRAEGEKFSDSYVLLLPSWGRWYKKRLWVLIKL